MAILNSSEPVDWTIWSNEHGAWWGPREHGYTPLRWDAGLYTRTRALKIVEQASYGWDRKSLPHEIPIPARWIVPGESQRYIRDVIHLASRFWIGALQDRDLWSSSDLARDTIMMMFDNLGALMRDMIERTPEPDLIPLLPGERLWCLYPSTRLLS